MHFFNIKNIGLSFYTILFLIIVFSCSTTEQTINNQSKKEATEIVQIHDIEYKKPGDYNFIFIGICKLNNNDKYAEKMFFRILINNIEIGRTETGKLNESVCYKGMIPTENNQELRVVMYTLDSEKRRYVKVKNIEQPKPDRFVFTIPKDRIMIVNLLISGNNGESVFSADFEK